MVSVLNVTVSCFANYQATQPKDVNLIKFLKSEKYSLKVEVLRLLKDPLLRQNFKEKLPAITPSGIFSERKSDALIKHSGLLQFDIDFKENQHITNYNELKNQISNIKNIAYCGLSVSGNGFWGLVPILFPEKHKQHFKTLQMNFLKLGIILDSAPSNVASLRGYSYDPDAYFNHKAEVLQRFFIPPVYKPSQFPHHSSDEERKVQKCITEIEKQQLDITGTYQEWLIVGFSLAGAFGENGRDYFHRVSRFYPGYSIQETDKQFNRCLKGSGHIGTFLKICYQNGISYKNL